MPFRPGQRWISEAEPELGLGCVRALDGRQVVLSFPAADEERRYLASAAPLKRVKFREGDVVQTADTSLTVERVEDRDGILVYHGPGGEVPETDLPAALTFSRPEERLSIGQTDGLGDHRLRQDTLDARAEIARSPVRGLLGARVALLPHQLFIADEVASRQSARVLLADEVGLGKTIEAGLILHRRLTSGRASRVLVVVPDALVHQWLVELLRRFHLWFRIYDEERCAAIEMGGSENPFLDEQLVLTTLGFLASHPNRARQALQAEWDVLVVDEAHRLEWSEDAPSIEYRLVDAIAQRADSVLLLTATPEQLGRASHFARLRLLDPHRYSDLESFEAESQSYQPIARMVRGLLDDGRLSDADLSDARQHGLDDALADRVRNYPSDEAERRAVLRDLIDRHGTGRVMFRNTRKAIPDFPGRTATLVPLEAPATRGRRAPDPRIPWLLELLRSLPDEKILLICETVERVSEIEKALGKLARIKTAVFHERLAIVQRDRNAAWFAEPEGARLLLCSEIGSEGRNFQFAHHLVLFDLPLDPEVIEQRIGRLDRIGQSERVKIHVPYVAGTGHEVIARWHHEGLDALETSLRGGRRLLDELGPRVADLAAAADSGDADPAEVVRLIEESRTVRDRVAAEIEAGRDRLLEVSSFLPDRATEVIDEIEGFERAGDLQDWLYRVFDVYGVQSDDLGSGSHRLDTEQMYVETFPELPPEGLTVTFSRDRALAREEQTFLTWDHPLIHGAMDMIIGSERGNAAFGVWPDDDGRELLLETTFVVECIAPARLESGRFLPPLPVRVVIDQTRTDRTEDHRRTDLDALLEPAPIEPLIERREVTADLLPAMLEAARDGAELRARSIREKAAEQMREELGRELSRLVALREQNGLVRAQEITLAEEEILELGRFIAEATLRLDSVRLIWKGPRAVLEG